MRGCYLGLRSRGSLQPRL